MTWGKACGLLERKKSPKEKRTITLLDLLPKSIEIIIPWFALTKNADMLMEGHTLA